MIALVPIARRLAEPWLEKQARRMGTVVSGDVILCPRCRCCEMAWELCDECDGNGAMLYEDPEELESYVAKCHQCRGSCGWWHCACDLNGVHKK